MWFGGAAGERGRAGDVLLFRGFLYAGGLWLSFYLWSGGVHWCFCGITPVGAFRKTRFAARRLRIALDGGARSRDIQHSTHYGPYSGGFL